MIAPRSVAIIGASDDPARIGGRPLRYMVDSGYKGKIFPVNPNRESVQGLKAFPSMAEVPEPVDCAIIALPAKMVARVLEECAKQGAKSAIVFSSGFAEAGGDGEALQSELAAMAQATGIRVLGPNCLGVLNFSTRFFGTFSASGDAGYGAPGSLAIISQSGAYGTHLYSVADSWGLRVSHVLTTGNECDVDVAECIDWAADANEVKVIAAYAEGIRDGDVLIRALEKAREREKPIVFMKVGRSAAGAAAAQSHTAALAGSDQIYDALFAEYGVHRANTTEQLLDAAYACTAGVFPTGRSAGLVTISGGVGVQMADHAADLGLDIPPMPQDAQVKLKALLPFAATLNPVDVTAQFFNDVALVGENFSIMLDEGNYDFIVAFFTMTAASPYVIDPLLKELDALRKRFPDRLIILSLVGTRDVIARYRDAGYLTFEDPCRALDAAAALVTFGRSFSRDKPSCLSALRDAASVKTLPRRAYSEWSSRELLKDSGIPVVEAKLANSAEEAARAAEDFGAPVALKINSAKISHRTEIGGVILNAGGGAEASRAFETLTARLQKAQGNAAGEGMIVAPMISGGVETILGVQIDPVFGPAVMFGLGGVFVEIFEDVAFALAPFGRDEALHMIDETKGARILKGARGAPPSDIDALADALVALSQFAAEHAASLVSVDINPFVVLREGKGAMALDCLVVTREPE